MRPKPVWPASLSPVKASAGVEDEPELDETVWGWALAVVDCWLPLDAAEEISAASTVPEEVAVSLEGLVSLAVAAWACTVMVDPVG